LPSISFFVKGISGHLEYASERATDRWRVARRLGRFRSAGDVLTREAAFRVVVTRSLSAPRSPSSARFRRTSSPRSRPPAGRSDR